MKDSFWTCEAYAAYLKDNTELTNSTSGGAFYGMAALCIRMGGVCYGATMDDSFDVYHIRIATISELNRIRRSKYVQSRTGQAYKQARIDLEEGRLVLFSGTPCQIAGLKAFLDKDYSNLYTVDLFCHGVPSNTMFKKHLSFLNSEYGEKISEFQFRNKDTGWSPVRVSYGFQDRKEYHLCYEDIYYRLFDLRYTHRKSCYSCMFRSMASGSDMSIGDYWGIVNVHPEFKTNNRGVSAIIIKSNKGRELWENAKDSFVFLPTSVSGIARSNVNIYRSIGKRMIRNVFFEYCKQNDSGTKLDLKTVYEKTIKHGGINPIDMIGSFSLLSSAASIYPYDYRYSTGKHLSGTTLTTMFGDSVSKALVDGAYAKNAFRQNCIRLDWGKNLRNEINRNKAGEKIIIDLLDERLSILELNNGIKLAANEATMEATSYLDSPIKKLWIMSDIPEEEWKAGCDQLIELLKENYGEQNVIVVKLLMSLYHGDFDKKEQFPSHEHIQSINTELAKRYSYLCEKMPECKVVEMPDLNEVYTPDYYRHGCMPEYYDDNTYNSIGEKIYYALGEQGWKF